MGVRDLSGDDRLGDWMLTSSGRMFWPLDPRPQEVFIEDIARGLSMACRYGGQVTRFYSVAEHSVYVSRAVPVRFARQALLHDASEAYIADIIRPLKVQPEMRAYKKIEARLEQVIFKRFGVDVTSESTAAVKDVDNRILCDEYQVRAVSPVPWAGLKDLRPLGIWVAGWNPEIAEALFMQRFQELFCDRG